MSKLETILLLLFFIECILVTITIQRFNSNLKKDIKDVAIGINININDMAKNFNDLSMSLESAYNKFKFDVTSRVSYIEYKVTGNEGKIEKIETHLWPPEPDEYDT